MQYEIINPSDPYTIRASSREVAALTVALISNNYGLQCETGKKLDGVPTFIFGNFDEWFENTFNRTSLEAIEELKNEVIESLESCMLGNFSDRERYELACQSIDDEVKLKVFKEKWLDARSSINNIGGIAFELAQALREQMKKV